MKKIIACIVGFLGAASALAGPTDMRSIQMAIDGVNQIPRFEVFPGAGVKCLRALDGSNVATGPNCFTVGSGIDVTAGVISVPSLVGPAGETGATGATGATGPQGEPGTPAINQQRLRAQTDTAGVYVWTFPTPFAGGVIPVVQVSVEDSVAGVTWGHQLMSVTNTAATIQLSKSTAVTVLGVSVLGVGSNPQAFVHLTAIAP